MADNFFKTSMKIAVPVALQAMLQSSFSIIDQIMVGQFGMNEVAAVEIGGKPGFVFSFVSGAVAAICGIMVSQYLGKHESDSVDRAISANLLVVTIIGAATTLLCLLAPVRLAMLFTADGAVIGLSSDYIRAIAIAYSFTGICAILSVPIRCMDHPEYTLYISAVAAVINTGLNYLLIFGHLGLPALGVRGAAIASVISQAVAAVMTVLLFLHIRGRLVFSLALGSDGWRQYFIMLLPVVVNELLWSVGQNVYTAIYGHLGTAELAGMALTGPIQGLLIGMLSGVSQAAGILIGKRLGEGDFDTAYDESKRLMLYGVIGSVSLSVLLILLRAPYTTVYQVGDNVRSIGAALLLAFAALAPIKVANMILGGGIIRSGGRTTIIMIIDLCGTWLVGVPLGILTGLVLHLPIVWVYFIMSQEELFRLIISIIMFRKKSWMRTIA